MNNEEKLEKLTKKIVETYRKKGDVISLLSPNGKLKSSWTGNELADEIENKTEFGLKLIDNLIQLGIDLLARDKINYNDK